MLQAFRAARWGRVLLFAAALLAAAGSFGLHPEPQAQTRIAIAPGSLGGVGWTSTSAATSGAHDCLACLAHRSVSLSGLAVFAPTASRAVGAAAAIPTRRLPLFAPRLDDGRAPPALL